MNDNYYDELGVEPGATRDEIRDAHRQRVADLEAAREKKGVTESQLQANREQVARVRSAWNVLSDPFQRQRYDAQLAAPAADDVELVDDDAGPQAGTDVEVRGWRKLLAPPPPKPAASGAKNGANGKNAPAQPTNKRARPEPTIVLPSGMQLAEPRQRGMAMLFDIAILMVIYTGISFLLPAVIQSDYSDIVKQIDKVGTLNSAQNDVNDAQKALDNAKNASDTKSAQKDLTSAQKDVTKATKEVKDAGIKNPPTTAKASDAKEQDLRDSIVGTQYAISVTILVLGLLYLVPSTARSGRTFGMRNRRLRVVRVDGSPCGWWPAFIRFFIPLAVAFVLLIQLSTLAPLLGLAIVGWSFFDRNRQGIHDKLARTVVVAA
jgi:curved DNA-binding protein CbpA